jgi:hypothetical protein
MDEKPLRQCGVCYDKATGLHYGIISCEGCKVKIIILFLFIESILKKIHTSKISLYIKIKKGAKF